MIGDTPYERFGLRRMSKEELVDLTKQGVPKTPADEWNRTAPCSTITATRRRCASKRRGSSTFSVYGNFGDKRLIVNALWYSKPKAK